MNARAHTTSDEMNTRDERWLDYTETSHDFLQLLEALEYLRGKKITRHDIKFQNVFLDIIMTAELANFG